MKSGVRSKKLCCYYEKTAYGALFFILKNLKIEGLKDWKRKKSEVGSQEKVKKVEKRKKSEQFSNQQIYDFEPLHLWVKS